MKEQPPALNINLAPLDLNSFPLPPRAGPVVGSWRHQWEFHRAWAPFLARKTRGMALAPRILFQVVDRSRAAHGEWQEAQPKKHQDPEMRGPSSAPWMHTICEQRSFISNEPKIWRTTESRGIKLIGTYRQNLAISLNERKNKQNHSPSKTSCNQSTFFSYLFWNKMFCLRMPKCFIDPCSKLNVSSFFHFSTPLFI